jgi:hypothetical protein
MFSEPLIGAVDDIIDYKDHGGGGGQKHHEILRANSQIGVNRTIV